MVAVRKVLRATVAYVGAVVVAERKVPSATVLYLSDVLKVLGATGASFGAVLDVVLVAVGGGLGALGVV